MQVVSSSPIGGRIVVFDKVIDEIPGGVGLNVARLNTEPGNEYVLAGTPVYVDYATRKAEIVKAIGILDGGTASAPRVSKFNHFLVGDIVNDGAVGAKITAIDRTNAAYDTLTVNTALTLVAGAALAEGSATGSSTALLFTPNGLIKSIVHIANGNADASVVIAGSVREDSLPYPFPTAFKTALSSGTGKSLFMFFT